MGLLEDVTFNDADTRECHFQISDAAVQSFQEVASIIEINRIA